MKIIIRIFFNSESILYVIFFFQKYFADEKPTWSSGSGNINVDQSVAQYTGGLVKIDKDLSNASLGPTPMPELAHLSIGNLISIFLNQQQHVY